MSRRRMTMTIDYASRTMCMKQPNEVLNGACRMADSQYER